MGGVINMFQPFDPNALWDSFKLYVFNSLNDLLTRSQNFFWATLQVTIQTILGQLPLPYALPALESNMPLALQMYRHGLTWFWLFSYFINLRLLLGSVALILLLESLLIVPRIWLFLKRMIPFI